ncbi:hypothetical protein PV336_36830 [Streptomyces sp. MI02-2A]|jgi:hypothetical protein|uniref:hypothetical protein n=1 Tax=unclassified Streptomyces TaxID=2593676 RepID=UPI00074105E9|nr:MULTISPECIES: hypothetical protein [unclassified Streptomyces]KUJ34006.1 hypothetical protein ADL25_42910 [Streptomyces sp. NRRL F-5122]MDX3264696.1 hypothetical protein [Streptomyces sp. MI02-2A]REE58971.1 hypothetical protein BX257_1459 [Streptomyces sp. 3212.3]
MTHRPYRNGDRALHRLDRHNDETGPRAEPRPMTRFEQRLAGQMAAMTQAAQLGGSTPALRLRTIFKPLTAVSEEGTA